MTTRWQHIPTASQDESQAEKQLREKPEGSTWWHPLPAPFSQRPQMVQNMKELRTEGKGNNRLPPAQVQADPVVNFWAVLNSLLLPQEG